MEPRLRTVFRLLALLVGFSIYAVGRWSFADAEWKATLFRTLDPAGAWVSGAFEGMTTGNNALPFFVAMFGCVVAAFGLPAARGGPRWPAVPVRVLSPRERRLPAILAALAAAIALLSVPLLRAAAPANRDAVLWSLSLPFGAIAAFLLDRRRATGFGSPLPQRADWIAVSALFLGCFVLVGHDVGHWRWMGTPDEANFFPFAREIALGQSHHFFLQEAGMYDVHPILSSVYQAAFMRLFGVDIVGWRLSSVFALAASLPCVYLVARELWDRRTAILAAVFFGASPLAIGFAHFGYNNEQIYLPVTGTLAALVWAMRRRSLFGYWLAGTIAGLSVFTFYPARLAGPLAVVLALAVRELPWSQARGGDEPRKVPWLEWSALIAAALIAATPCLVHPLDTLQRMTGQTTFQPPRASPGAEPPPSPPLLDTLAQTGGRLLRHWNVSTNFPIWYPNPSHFQSNAVIDPLQGGLAICGLVLALRGFRRDAGSRFLALSYLLSALLVGSVSQHATPPLTRLLFLCPFIGLAAALSLRQAHEGLVSIFSWPRLAAIVTGAVVAGSALWGFALVRYNVYVRNHGYGEGTTSELVRTMSTLPGPWRVVYVQRMPTYMASVDAVISMYGWHERFDYLRQSSEILKHMPNAGEVNLLLIDDLPPGEARDELEGELSRRFPGREWRESAPGKPWNLRSLAVARQGDGGWRPPEPPPQREDPVQQMLLGSFDW